MRLSSLLTEVGRMSELKIFADLIKQSSGNKTAVQFYSR